MKKVILVEDNGDIIDGIKELFEYEHEGIPLEVFSGDFDKADRGLGDFVNEIREAIKNDPQAEYVVILDDKLGFDNMNGAVVINALVAIPEIAERIQLIIGNSGDTGAQDGYLKRISEPEKTSEIKAIPHKIAKKDSRLLQRILKEVLVENTVENKETSRK